MKTGTVYIAVEGYRFMKVMPGVTPLIPVGTVNSEGTMPILIPSYTLMREVDGKYVPVACVANAPFADDMPDEFVFTHPGDHLHSMFFRKDDIPTESA